MADTNLGDITKDGFDIYVKEKESSNMDYNKLLTSGDYKNYPLDRSISLKKGFQRYNDTVYKAPYLLVKDGLVVGNIGFYGDKDRETVIEDCKIVYLRLEKAYIDAARANSISYKLDGVDLLDKLKLESLQKNFGEKKAVDIESYMIDQGDMLGLVGNNGAGKTTLFRLILDLLKADAGNVTINDVDVSKSEEWKKFTGAFIDDGFLIDYLTHISTSSVKCMD